MLISSGTMVGVYKISTQDEDKNALKGDMNLNKKVLKLGELKELAYDDFYFGHQYQFLCGKGGILTGKEFVNILVTNVHVLGTA